MKKLLLVGAVIALFGAGCLAKTVTQQPSATETTDNRAPAAVPEAAPTPTIENSITVTDQKSGDAVMIEMVSIEKKGVVVVHEDDGGKVGKIVGTSSLLNAGETKAVTVKMKIHADLSHLAMLHVDNGDGVFDEKQDLSLKNENGDYVMMSFKGEGEATKTEEKKME